IYPTLFRRTPKTDPKPERIETEDGDFLDIDWHYNTAETGKGLVVVIHGLEGNSRKKYPLGMARHLNRNGWDVICLNFRCCSGEPNRLPRFYHSGVTDDLHRVLCHGLARGYERAMLVGFSMGGNQTLKYLGENPELVPPQVEAAITFSVPCQLGDAVQVMNRAGNRVYMKYFMAGLKAKIKEKAVRFPDLIDTEGLEQMETFEPFDDKYTAPLHGFKDAADYYKRCSSVQFLEAIGIPTLVVQAEDDPFLPPSCYPVEQAEKNKNLFLEIPGFGGHVGFMGAWLEQPYWSEKRARLFFDSLS
ncbi:MAG: alpha/beta fold hydrolase, partial [Desulfofustis sp.]